MVRLNVQCDSMDMQTEDIKLENYLQPKVNALMLSRHLPTDVIWVGTTSLHSLSRVDPKSDNYAIIDFR